MFSSRKREKGSPRERPARRACCWGEISSRSFQWSNRARMVIQLRAQVFRVCSVPQASAVGGTPGKAASVAGADGICGYDDLIGPPDVQRLVVVCATRTRVHQ